MTQRRAPVLSRRAKRRRRRRRGTGSLRAHGTGWEAVITVTDPDTGASRPLREKFNTESDAEDWLNRTARAIERNQLRQLLGVSFRRAALEYLDYKCDDPMLSETHLDGIEGLVYNHLLPFFGDYALSEIHADRISRYRNQKLRGTAPVALDADGRAAAKDQLAPQTVVHHLNTLNAIFRYARLREWTAADPLEHVSYPTIARPPVEPYDAGDILELLGLLPLDAEGLFHVLLHLGLRLGEALGLRDQDLLLESGIVRIRGSLKRRRDEEGRGRLVWVPKPKSKHGWREFRVSDELVGYLGQLRTKMRSLPDQTGHGLLFRTEPGTAISPDNFRNRVWVPAVCTAHLKGMHAAELDRLLSVLPESVQLPVKLLAHPGALHLEALLRARWAEYDAVTGTLSFADSKGAETAVKFSTALRKELRSRRSQTFVRPDARRGGLIVPGPLKRHVAPWNRNEFVRLVFRQGFPAAGIEFDKRVHRLRHTYASAVGLMGAELRRLQQLLGHSRYTQTVDLYVHYYERRAAPIGDTMAMYQAKSAPRRRAPRGTRI